MARLLLVFAFLSITLAAQSKPGAVTEAGPAESRQAVNAAAFAALFKYCPAQVESVMCLSPNLLPAREPIARLRDIGNDEGDLKMDRLPPRVRVLNTGSKFMFRGVGIGDYEGVTINEFERDLPPLSQLLNLTKFTRETIDGVDCYLRASHKAGDREEGPVEDWTTVLDGRFLVEATRRAMLKEAIARKGMPMNERLKTLGWEPGTVSWSSPMVIVRKFDPSNQKDAYSPVSKQERISPTVRGFRIESAAFFYDDAAARKARLLVTTAEPQKALAYYRELLGAAFPGDSRRTTSVVQEASDVQGRLTLSIRFEDDKEGLELLCILTLFGYNIFI